VNLMSAIQQGDAFVPHTLAQPIVGRENGPLTGFTVAVKDMFDIRGERTGGGNPDWLANRRPASAHASAVERLLAAGATIIGKTICDEFFFSLAGVNEHYGTPRNPRAPGRLPGGSSSGSAAAVAASACDFAIGSDTGGSVRVPASFCGLYGIRPTHGRVDMTGAMGMSPSFDTVGWFAAGPGLLRKVGAALLGEGAVVAPIKTVLLGQDCFSLADDAVGAAFKAFMARASAVLPIASEIVIAPQGYDAWRNTFRIVQAREIWAIYGAWMEAHQPKLGSGIRERFAYAKTVGEDAGEAAHESMVEVRAAIRGRISPGTVLIIPTTPCIAPSIDANAEELEHFRLRTMALTCIAGLGGLPQVTMPVGTVAGAPIGLSLVGWAGGDEALLDLAVSLARFCGIAG
jgi:amidase